MCLVRRGNVTWQPIIPDFALCDLKPGPGTCEAEIFTRAGREGTTQLETNPLRVGGRPGHGQDVMKDEWE